MIEEGTTIDQLCFWKKIELKDKEKQYKKELYATFSEDTKCAKCDGYNTAYTACKDYLKI